MKSLKPSSWTPSGAPKVAFRQNANRFVVPQTRNPKRPLHGEPCDNRAASIRLGDQEQVVFPESLSLPRGLISNQIQSPNNACTRK